MAAHGLEALSAAASQDQYSFMNSSSAPDSQLLAEVAQFNAQQDAHLQQQVSPTASRHPMLPPHSPSASVNSTNNNINFLLNPQSSMSPVIDPSLESPIMNRDSFSTSSPVMSTKSRERTERTAESDHEVAFLLRHFAEAPGSW